MKKMLWIDLEMTGLDDNTDKILEVAVIITDLNFEELDVYHRIVLQPQSVLDSMNDWCKKTHGASGLTKLVPTGTPIETVEQELVALMAKHYPIAAEKLVLCGNSVGNDRRFIDRYLKEFAKRLHYRLVDVSSFKEVFRSKYKIEVKKGDAHRAVDDVRESIRELKHYLSFVTRT